VAKKLAFPCNEHLAEHSDTTVASVLLDEESNIGFFYIIDDNTNDTQGGRSISTAWFYTHEVFSNRSKSKLLYYLLMIVLTYCTSVICSKILIGSIINALLTKLGLKLSANITIR
jgi:hypothetical protein